MSESIMLSGNDIDKIPGIEILPVEEYMEEAIDVFGKKTWFHVCIKVKK